ncbi:hypothetical protein NOC27_590 [Nitrosococcus oceani AFC27]|nr:hypothetical protein [Nitrosococcus oceani]EDZ67263.1 hypothetical protein NOC27_590 [Nitrosococcus oceani AFC27]
MTELTPAPRVHYVGLDIFYQGAGHQARIPYLVAFVLELHPATE